jgi:hypothetical protein
VEGGLLYIGIPAVTLYPLGFIALGIQLWRDPSFPYHDFTTIWEAVSLIPQTVVVATGIRLIYTHVPDRHDLRRRRRRFARDARVMASREGRRGKARG